MPRLRVSRRSLCVAMAVTFLLGSCAVATFNTYAPQSDDRELAERRVEGLAVRVQAFADQSKIDQYLGADLLDRNILPVFVSIKNYSSTSRYIVLKQDFRIELAGTLRTSRETEAAAPTSLNTAIGVAGIVLVSPLLILAGGKMFGDAAAAEHNMIKQGLRSDTLNPGQEVSGFLYFPVGDRPVAGNVYNLQIEASNPQTNTRLEFAFELTIKK